MALASLHLFIWVESFFATHFCRLDTLAIHTTDTWFSLTPSLGPDIAAQERVDVLPRAVITPSSIILPDVIPGREIARQHSPLTPGSDPIEDGVQHFADVDRSTGFFVRRAVRL